jgi:hypothetical protein
MSRAKPTRRELMLEWRTIPCPDMGCAGEVLVPKVGRTEPTAVECDGIYKHKWWTRRI